MTITTPEHLHLSSQERALLRRLDWRVLLPPPPTGTFDHLVLLGGTPELAHQVAKIGLARHVSQSLPPEPIADVVVKLQNAPLSLDTLATSLKPGGLFYGEVARPAMKFKGTPSRLQQLLKEAGLQPLGSYAVRPSFNAIEMFIPLQVRHALKWYVNSLYPAASLRQHFFELLLRSATSLDNNRFSPLAPYVALVAVAGEGESVSDPFYGYQALPASLRKEKLYPLMLTDGGNRVTILPFTADGNEPLAIIKIPKLASFNDRTENEHYALRQVRSQLGTELKKALPTPLALQQQGTVAVGVESYLSGQSLVRSSGRWGMPLSSKLDDLWLVTWWLSEFHQQTACARPRWADAQSAWLHEPLVEYEQCFGVTEKERRLFARARVYASSLHDVPFPLVWQHRDFNVWNLFRDGKQLNVIDWEGGRIGPALCDLLHFLVHWHETTHHLQTLEDQLTGFEELAFNSASPKQTVQAAHTAIAFYSARVMLDQRFFPLLLLYLWVEMALRRATQQRDMNDIPAEPRAGNRNFAFIEVLANRAEQLFQGSDSE